MPDHYQAHCGHFFEAVGNDISHATNGVMFNAFTHKTFPAGRSRDGFAPDIVNLWHPWPERHATPMKVRILDRKPKDENMPEEEYVPWATVEEWSELGKHLENRNRHFHRMLDKYPASERPSK